MTTFNYGDRVYHLHRYFTGTVIESAPGCKGLTKDSEHLLIKDDQDDDCFHICRRENLIKFNQKSEHPLDYNWITGEPS